MKIEDQYKNLSVAELEGLDCEYHRTHWTNGGSSEFDTSINDISRAMIVAYHAEHGRCFLGKINDYDQYGKDPQIKFVPYEGQMVYNFGYAFIIPQEDERLRALIKDHNTQKIEYDSKEAYDVIEKITSRIAELGGTFLSWS